MNDWIYMLLFYSFKNELLVRKRSTWFTYYIALCFYCLRIKVVLWNVKKYTAMIFTVIVNLRNIAMLVVVLSVCTAQRILWNINCTGKSDYDLILIMGGTFMERFTLLSSLIYIIWIFKKNCSFSKITWL